MNQTLRRGFSLVEVVIALGIIAFAITAMIGLLAVAMQSDRSSSADTALASMSRQVLNSLRASPYAALPASTNYFFDGEGSECEPSIAIYQCAVTLTDDPDIAPSSLTRVEMRFAWQGGTNILQTAIANHGH